MLWYRNQLIIQSIRQFFPNAHRILEAGAGTGMVLSALAREFPDRTIHASELFLSGLEIIRRVIGEAPVKLFQMDATRMPFDQEYDLIGMFDVIEHIDDDRLVINNVFDALKPGGGFILTIPQHPELWSKADDAVLHKRRYRPGELPLKLKDAGFEILRATSYNTLLVPAMMLARALERGEYRPDREWSLHPALNAVLLGIVKIEKLFLDVGINLPVGGSQIVVTRKS
ncbi:class I SAM-dependent methyltransferase [Rhodospirillales bacterium]|nr:class I SAM-dependent methyltransferase [Rhodospirillales bacterium]